MSIYYQDEHVTLHHGDAATVLAELPAQSVDCIVTSPPYFGLRDYGQDGQIGAELTPAEFVTALVAVFAEAHRVLADDGTLWLNLGDSYTGGGGGNYGAGKSVKSQGGQQVTNVRNRPEAPQNGGLPPKNLLGIPWRVAFALQEWGWILRNDIIWAKPNGMPESVRDRLSNRHEHLFMFSKQARYSFDLNAIREPQSPESIARRTRGDSRTKPGWSEAYSGNPPKGLARQSDRDTDVGRNPGDVWEIATSPFPGAHFATMPLALAERAVLAGCQSGWTVLDPFSGSGTTGLAAAKHGRKYVGIDLSKEYLDLSLRTRLSQTAFDFTEVSA